jgi:hypothetical protein
MEGNTLANGQMESSMAKEHLKRLTNNKGGASGITVKEQGGLMRVLAAIQTPSKCDVIFSYIYQSLLIQFTIL